MEQMRHITEVEVEGKRVLLRTSLNVPVAADGSVGDTFRLTRGLKTISYLVEHGARVILVGYIGREGASLAPVAAALQKLSPNTPITFTTAPLSEVGSMVEKLGNGECLLLENIRREAGEEKNDPELAKQLASFGDIFVDDAFAEAHRPYASNLGVASLLPAYAGLLLAEEVEVLSEALEPHEGAVAVIGGAKFETKEPLITTLVELYGSVLLGGALANDLLKARGMPVGSSLVSGVPVPTAIAADERIEAPIDLVVESDSARPSNTADVRNNERIVDIGERTMHKWVEHILKSSFVVWNGPLGIYEKGYVAGTDALADALVKSTARAIIGGGDTAAALAKYTFDPKRIFVSTGGGAMLEFLATHGKLPVLDVLKK